jgi:hypothetical protein
MMTMRVALVLAFALGACDQEPQGDDMGAGGDGGSTTEFDLACGSATSRAELVPVSLVVLLDRSGSMGDGVNGDRTLKWDPVTQALAAFFGDAASSAVSASLVFFPYADNPAEQCNQSAYYFPKVPLRPLPDAPAFTAAMNATSPGGNTPTRPAILGVIDYAKDEAAKKPGARFAIVLVTDGEPDSCGSSVTNVSLEVAKVAATIPTYVIGVGSALGALDMIAQSGGTLKATHLNVGDPVATKAQFLSALDGIRGLVVSCTLPVPQPPAGKTFVFNQANVLFTPGSGSPSLLLYDRDCSSGVGWRYDDEANPKTIELCAQTCATAQADRMARVEVVFGCATAGDLIQ